MAPLKAGRAPAASIDQHCLAGPSVAALCTRRVPNRPAAGVSRAPARLSTLTRGRLPLSVSRTDGPSMPTSRAVTGSLESGGSDSDGANSGSTASSSGRSTTATPRLLFSRKVLACPTAADAADLLGVDQGWQAAGAASAVPTEADCLELILAALDRGNVQLALSVHQAMCSARRTSSSTRSSLDACFEWPAAGITTTAAVVVSLCRQLATAEAMAIIRDVRVQGLPRNDDVHFGKVIGSPLEPSRTLAVVQPQEGSKLVADAYSRYEYELFSGRVVTSSSEALQPPPGGIVGLLLAGVRRLGLASRPPATAVHTFVVQAPDGMSRTFRTATEQADVPAQVGDRITLVCAPRLGARTKKKGFLSAAAPGTKPGQAMTCTNHATGAVTQLLLAPPPGLGSSSGIPSWYMPAAVLLASSDAASYLVDPILPGLLAAGAVATIGGAVAGNQMLLPMLKQLPATSVEIEYTRQKLLGEYASLASKVNTAMQESAEDVRVLARLWQLQNKMEAVIGITAGYQARIERVAAARRNIEDRLSQRLELLDGYSRVMNMIEIEVEMETEVPAAEVEGIAVQLARLADLEALQDDWRAQAEARDEVERLLRTVP